ncbi:uncharacterized protein K452DRAFT_240074, partial [Aplosporella prunicola CBS 121167]
STVDLVLASPGIANRIVYYQIYKIDYRSNHRAIESRFNVSLTKVKPKEGRYLFKDAD